MPLDEDNTRYIKPSDLAQMLAVSERTITRWCKAGRLPGAIKTSTERGRWRIPVWAVNTIICSELNEDRGNTHGK